MDEDRNKLRNDSMGTNYTFRDKHGNLITSSDRGLATEEDNRSAEKTTDIPHLNIQSSKPTPIFQHSNMYV